MSTGSAATPTAQFLWPGYGENCRVLAWIFERCDGRGGAVETPIGHLPDTDALDTAGLDLAPERLNELLAVELDAWRHEVELIEEHYARFGDRLPDTLRDELVALDKRLVFALDKRLAAETLTF